MIEAKFNCFIKRNSTYSNIHASLKALLFVAFGELARKHAKQSIVSLLFTIIFCLSWFHFGTYHWHYARDGEQANAHNCAYLKNHHRHLDEIEKPDYIEAVEYKFDTGLVAG